MALDDLFETEVVVAVGATAALMSERARRVLRRGAVYGIAGVMSASDAVAAAARNVGRDGDRMSADGDGAPATVAPPRPARKARTT